MRTDVLLDRAGGRVIASATQDVEPILERNQRLRAETQRGDLRHVATIPNVILLKWLNEEHARGNTKLRLFTKEFDELVARRLADPDWAYLRTA
jgi:hypothetical protein